MHQKQVMMHIVFGYRVPALVWTIWRHRHLFTGTRPTHTTTTIFWRTTFKFVCSVKRFSSATWVSVQFTRRPITARIRLLSLHIDVFSELFSCCYSSFGHQQTPGGVMDRMSDVRSRGRGFDFRSRRYQVVTTQMDDCLRTRKPSITKVNSAFHPSVIGESSTSLSSWG